MMVGVLAVSPLMLSIQGRCHPDPATLSKDVVDKMFGRIILDRGPRFRLRTLSLRTFNLNTAGRALLKVLKLQDLRCISSRMPKMRRV